MTQPPMSPDPEPTTSSRPIVDRVRQFARDYAWWIAKNVLGYTLMLASVPLGALVPGPGGIPVFLIGFAMVSFPGKRHLTARVFRGIPIDLGGNAAGFFSGMATVVLPLASAVLLRVRYERVLSHEIFSSPWVAAMALGAMGVSFILVRLTLYGINAVIRLMPKVRRFVRPWMRHKGIDLLPPRRRRRYRAGHPGGVDQEILEIDPKYGQQMTGVWKRVKPWLRRGLALGLLGVIFYYMLRPVRGRWGEVGSHILEYDMWRFLVATALFASFLYFFRCITWLKIIKGFGYRLPAAAGARIWVTGELARYLPGTVWQILGRVYLIKPYGVPGRVCSTSQVLDIVAFLLANLLVGMACLFWFWGKAADTGMRPYLIGGVALLPLLMLALHPRVFYGVANRVLQRLGKPAFEKESRLRGKKLTKYFFIYLAGLALQSAALYVLLGDALHIKPDHWWKIAGPYCLAWCAGFLVGWWTPGGLGVRELVFVGMLKLTLDQTNRNSLPEGDALIGYLVFCSVLLRLWTIAGELTVASIAYTADYKGALNRPDAPGRVKPTDLPADETLDTEAAPTR